MVKLRLSDIRSALFVRVRSLGDTVLFTPAVFNFKRACPRARLTVAVDEISSSVLSGNPHVDEIIILPTGLALGPKFRCAFRVLRSRFDLVVDFHGGARGAIATLLSRARHRVGWADGCFSLVYNIRVPRAREVLKTRNSIHTVAKNLALLSFLGVPIVSTRPALFVDPRSRQSLGAKLKEAGLNDCGPVLLVHIGASKKRKEFPPGRMASALAACVMKTSMRPVVVGAKQDVPRSEEVLGHLSGEAKRAVISLVGKLSLEEVKALCQKAAAYLGPDTGIMHVADALETPSVVLLGKTEMRLWHPWSSPHIILRPCPDSNCHSCPHYRTRAGCLALTSEEQILEAILDLEELVSISADAAKPTVAKSASH